MCEEKLEMIGDGGGSILSPLYTCEKVVRAGLNGDGWGWIGHGKEDGSVEVDRFVLSRPRYLYSDLVEGPRRYCRAHVTHPQSSG